MGYYTPSHLLLCLFLLFMSIAMSLSTSADRRTYIIHVDKSAMPAPFSTHHTWYMSILSSLSSSDGSVELEPTHLYTYNHVMNGFSAVLSQSQLAQLEKMPGHLATYPEKFGHLHTTHTPKFLGLKKFGGLWPAAGFGDDMIIGIIDSGIWPESESFNDEGMPPVPERWRGTCETSIHFKASSCNRKLIGARSFSEGTKQIRSNKSKSYDDYDSPRDFMGHGTHTSSTAAGSWVQNADYFGYAKGTAIGMAPMARLAMYRVEFGESDTLAGMDRAIADGVDLISLSLGFHGGPFYVNPIALGAFAAMEKGIFVSCSAGNSGPSGYSVDNGAPWITTVGAGSIDREFEAHVTLGDDILTVTGKSIYPENLFVFRVPLYFGYGNRSKEICDSYALNPKEVEGKFIFCDFNDKILVFEQLIEVQRSGAAGGIFSSDIGKLVKDDLFTGPFVIVLPKDGKMVKDYIIKSDNPTVDVKFLITILGTTQAPQVADFSSRGPDKIAPWILKPDILAPGVNILAAWASNYRSALIRDGDFLLTDYAIASGTSMSSPHIVGIAALLKALHRDWSPAAIRSAMMTTADVLDNTNGPIIDMKTGVAASPLDFGGGHVNPNKAMDPGLVYDIEVQDYVNFLCGLNYSEEQIRIITRGSYSACEQANVDLNYPAFIVILNNTNTTTSTFKRVLTNVADSPSVYQAVVNAPILGMKVIVQPATLSFPQKYSKAEFNLTVEINLGASLESNYIGNYGYLRWYEVNGKRIVTSPIVSAFAYTES